MTAIQAIRNYLITNNVLTQTNSILGHIPPNPDTIVSFSLTSPIYRADNIGQPYNAAGFQVRSRSLSQQTAYTNCAEIYNWLHNLGGQIEDIWFVEIVALQGEPVDIGKDSLNRYEYTQNYRFEYYKQTRNRS